MIEGKLVRLRAITPADYPRLTEFKNDVEYELLGGGIPPRPRTASAVAEFFDKVTKERDEFTFAIEADGQFIGDCALHGVDQRSGVAELGIGIGDRAYWVVGTAERRSRCWSITASGCRTCARSG